jgi:hypothetical protein
MASAVKNIKSREVDKNQMQCGGNYIRGMHIEKRHWLHLEGSRKSSSTVPPSLKFFSGGGSLQEVKELCTLCEYT